MVGIINDIITRYGTKGAEKALATNEKFIKSNEKIGRVQTRQGQVSASVGRQFSAQAAGLGGLVGAYAGAAANIFAITQAFSALSRAAQADQTIQGTRTLALEIGASGDKIINTIQEITKAQLTMAETAQNVNIALSAGFNEAQIERLSVVSLKAARALGRNLTDAFQRVVRGAAKLEPELLDELGIFTRIDPAVEKYASRLQVSVTSLTNFEKRQAFVNAVIEEGEKKFSTINTTLPTTLEKLEKLSATIIDLATDFGVFIADTLTPFIDFFGDKIGNAVLLFGGILALVLNKSGALVSGFVNSALAKFTALSLKLQNLAINVKGTGAEFNAALKAAQTGATGFAGGFVGLSRDDAKLAREARDRARAGGSTDLNVLKKDQEILQKVIKAEQQYQKELKGRESTLKDADKAQANSTARLNAARATIAGYTTAITHAGAGTKFFAGAAAFATIAVKGLSIAFSIATKILNIFFITTAIAQLVGTIFDVDLLAEVSNWWKKLTKDAKELTKGIEGLAQLSTDDPIISKIFSVEDLQRGSKQLQDSIKEITSSIEIAFEARNKVAKLLINAADLTTVQPADAGSSLIKAIGDLGQVTKLSGTDLKEFIEDTTDLNKVQLLQAITTSGLEIKLKELNDRISTTTDKTKLGSLAMDIFVTQTVLDRVRNLTLFMARLSGQLSAITSVPVDRVADIFSEAFLSPDTSLLVKAFGDIKRITEITEEGEIVLDAYGIRVLSVVTSTVTFADLLDRTRKAFKAGNLEAENFSQKIGGLRAIIDSTNKIIEEASVPSASGFGFLVSPNLQAAREAITAIAAFNEELEKQVTLLNELKSLEFIGKGIRKSFSGELSSFENALFTGKVSVTGEVAKNAKEIQTNRIKFLELALQKGIEAKRQIIETNDKLSEQSSLVELIAVGDSNQTTALRLSELAVKTLIGSYFKLNEEVEKLLISSTNRLNKLENQFDIIRKQNTLLTIQNKIKEEKADQKRDLELLTIGLKIDKTRLDIFKQQIEAREKTVKVEKEIVNLYAEQNKLSNDILIKQIELRASVTTGAGQANLARASEQLASLEATPNLVFEETLLQKREEIVQIEHLNAVERLNLRKFIADLEHTNALNDLKAKTEQFRIEQRSLENQLTDQSTLINKEIELQKAKNILELTKIQNEQTTLKARELELLDIRQIELDKITFARQEKQAQLELERIKVNNLKIQAEVFRDFLENFDESINKFIEGVNAQLGVRDIAPIAKDDLRFESIIGKIGSIDILLNRIIGTENQIATSRQATVEERFRANERERSTQLRHLNTVIAQTKVLHDLEGQLANAKSNETRIELENKLSIVELAISNAEKEVEVLKLLKDIKDQDLKNELAQLILLSDAKKAAFARERDTLTKILDSSSAIIKEGLGSALRDLNIAIRDGTLTMQNFEEGFDAMIFSLGQSLQENLIEKLIIDPVLDIVGGLFGATSDRLGDYANAIGNALRVEVINSNLFNAIDVSTNRPTTAGGFGPKPEDVKQTGSALSMFAQDFNQFGIAIVGSFAQILASGGNFKQAIIGIFLSIFAQILVSSIGSSGGFFDFGRFFGSGGLVNKLASGGIPKFASGGLRDRMPALLEPGEFVVRRPIVNKVGTASMQRLNATGKMTGSGQPIINIHNEGTPQESAGQPQIAFDMEKLVIDIFVKDFESNGATRRTFRGNKIR